MAATTGLAEIQQLYPTDEACLQKIFQIRFAPLKKVCPKCGKKTTFYRVKKRKCYECQSCGYQLFPTAGTLFEKTRTSLILWFCVMHLMAINRNRITAKDIQRQLGITYKSARRLARETRPLPGRTLEEKLASALSKRS